MVSVVKKRISIEKFKSSENTIMKQPHQKVGNSTYVCCMIMKYFIILSKQNLNNIMMIVKNVLYSCDAQQLKALVQ